MRINREEMMKKAQAEQEAYDKEEKEIREMELADEPANKQSGSVQGTILAGRLLVKKIKKPCQISDIGIYYKIKLGE